MAASKSSHLDLVLVVASGEQRGLVDHVLEIRPAEPRGPPGQDVQVHVVGEGQVPGVDPEDAHPTLDVGPRDHHLAVEATGTQEGRIEDVGPVGGRDQDHALVGLEAVHLDEELVERLLTLVVAPSEARSPVAPHRVDLVDEDDAGSVLLALHEEVAYAGRAHPDEHLHEVGSADREEGHARLAGDRPGEQGLPRPRSADQQHALRDPTPEARELLGILEERDDLLELLLRLVDPPRRRRRSPGSGSRS